MEPSKLYKSILLELLSFALFINLNIYTLVPFLTLHGLALFIITSLLASIIPKRFKDRRKAIFVFFIILYPTLYLGYIFLLVAVFYLLRKQKVDVYQPPRIPSLEEIITEDIKFSGRKIGEAALAVIQSGESKINPLRLETILSYLLNLESSQIIPALKKALAYSEDTIRLYAFGAISRIEKNLNQTLHALRERLSQEKLPPEEKAYLYYQIALIYYTFVHYKLADPEFRGYMLKEALENVKKSLEMKSTPEAKLLLAKIHIEMKQFDEALIHLESLMESKELNPVSYLMQLAEVYYERGDYKMVKRLIREHPEIELLLDVEANFVIRFWRGKNGNLR
ncbi:MAG: hypothetical protein ABWK02_07025 [Aquificaceae bacterium]|nr:hypothetical protein [Aquificaceae bacterium]